MSEIPSPAKRDWAEPLSKVLALWLQAWVDLATAMTLIGVFAAADSKIDHWLLTTLRTGLAFYTFVVTGSILLLPAQIFLKFTKKGDLRTKGYFVLGVAAVFGGLYIY